MAEIAIMVQDVVHDDPISDAAMWKRGDVISVLEDGADWGKLGVTNPRFRMIRLTGVAVSAAQMLLAPEVPTDPANISPMLRRRMFRFDLNHPSLTAQAL